MNTAWKHNPRRALNVNWRWGISYFEVKIRQFTVQDTYISKGAFVWDIPEQEYIPEYIPAILLLGAE